MRARKGWESVSDATEAHAFEGAVTPLRASQQILMATVHHLAVSNKVLGLPMAATPVGLDV